MPAGSAEGRPNQLHEAPFLPMNLLYIIPPAVLLLVVIILAIVGTLYAVLLGFLTVAAWQHFAASRDFVAFESAAAGDAWHMALGLPTPARSRVREDVLKYANAMIDHDWPDMQHGRLSTIADVIVMDAIGASGDFVPANLRESNAQAATLQQLGVLHDYRQRRISSSASGVSWFEWLILFVGAVCVIGFCWLVGSKNARAHLLMTSAVAIVIASTLVLLFELQYPFRSPIGIGPDAWQGIIGHIRLMQTGSQRNMRM